MDQPLDCRQTWPPAIQYCSIDPVLQYYDEQIAKNPKISRRRPIDVWNEHLDDLIARNITAGPCPKVGEEARAHSGQLEVTMNDVIARGVVAVSSDDVAASRKRVYFIPTSGSYKDRGTWIGVNAFGAMRQVDSHETIVKGVAIAMEGDPLKPSTSVTDRILLPANFPHAAAQNIVFGTPQIIFDDEHRLWVSGSVVGGSFDGGEYFIATISSPTESRYRYHADQTIKLECAAVVSKTGTVIQRLY